MKFNVILKQNNFMLSNVVIAKSGMKSLKMFIDLIRFEKGVYAGQKFIPIETVAYCEVLEDDHPF